jgi:DNA-directed RNA polymerase subunit M/transcription elongation factor TFIIS
MTDPCPWCGKMTLEITREEGDIYMACTDCEFEHQLDWLDLIDDWKAKNVGRSATEIASEDDDDDDDDD